jgi:hypothetical protein
MVRGGIRTTKAQVGGCAIGWEVASVSGSCWALSESQWRLGD